MPPGPFKFPSIKPPSNPIEGLRTFLHDSRELITDAGSDIRTLADEVRGFTTTDTQTVTRTTEPQKEATPGENETSSITQAIESATGQESIATACVPCAIGHFAGAARLLNEAIRFRDDGIESNQILDDIAGAIGEFNAMERVDLTPERLQETPGWEREIADEALRESRKFRHRLEGITSIEEIERAAADAETYYKKINRQWYKGRFAHLGPEKSDIIASEEENTSNQGYPSSEEVNEKIARFLNENK